MIQGVENKEPGDELEYISYLEVENCHHNLINLSDWDQLKTVVVDLDKQSNNDISCDFCGSWIPCNHLKKQRIGIPIILWTKKYNEALFCLTCNEKIKTNMDSMRVLDLSDHYDPVIVQIYKSMYAIFNLS